MNITDNSPTWCSGDIRIEDSLVVMTSIIADRFPLQTALAEPLAPISNVDTALASLQTDDVLSSPSTGHHRALDGRRIEVVATDNDAVLATGRLRYGRQGRGYLRGQCVRDAVRAQEPPLIHATAKPIT